MNKPTVKPSPSVQPKPQASAKPRRLVDLLDEVKDLKMQLQLKNKENSIQRIHNEKLLSENKSLEQQIESVKKEIAAPLEAEDELDRLRQLQVAMQLREVERRARDQHMFMAVM